MALVKYSLYRLILAAALTYVLWLIGFHIYLAVALAVVIAAMLSFIFLPKTGTAAANQLASFIPQRKRTSATAL
ncbi:MAG: DUF4229 domain-containing protein, partial [Bowdeniella nasicola]|nr:DUF4229 domain-containing protein [Bowdeniella nasicola]